MKLLSKLLFITISIIALALIIALFVDKDFNVERKITLKVKSDEVFTYLKNIKNQNDWSVWQQMDPTMEQTYTGEDGRIGFISAWKSKNEDVGEGEQEITMLHYPNRIETQLRFIKPIETTNNAYFNLTENEQETEVKWGIHGSTTYPMNIMYLFINMDSQIGPDLEEGLKNLKKHLEAV